MNFKSIAAAQRMTALAHPCEVAEQCAHPMYRFDVRPAQNIFCIAVLTVNVGEE